MPSNGDPPHISLGICAMEKKTSSKPMKEILSRIKSFGDIEIVTFPQDMILNAPVEEWPHPIDVLISFYSDGFPLEKAEAYASLRQPHCVNNLTSQHILLDRRKVYALLAQNGIPHPRSIVVERDPITGAATEHFEEADDHIIVGNQKVEKPFVEKPVDAEDHNVCIYYPSSAGGGVKNLFRKVENKSSDFDPSKSKVRKDATYMYEPFMKTGGNDIKVYTVGPDYAHAEARKSPVVDGIVMRNQEGKEVRIPIVLTALEKEIATKICVAFGQTVCGFDLLRTNEGSYVIDVNGWSFVKGLPKYYDDAAALLHTHIVSTMGSTHRIRSVASALELHASSGEDEGALPSNAVDGMECENNTSPVPADDRWAHEELLAVLAVLRHADRQPKNKLKLETRHPRILQLFKRWSKGAKKEAKLKSPTQLQEVLDLMRSMLSVADIVQDKSLEGTSTETQSAEATPLTDREREAFTLVRTVLQESGHFDGIYRKVQLKPVAWTPDQEVEKVRLVLKYGGQLTTAGVAQAEALGRRFRREMYPSEEEVSGDKHRTGLLRLHATQRHDFKVYSSEEGRVQMSAAAFTRGLLDLGSDALTPICAALIDTDSAMLDELTNEAETYMTQTKEILYKRITGEDRPSLGTPKASPPLKPHENPLEGIVDGAGYGTASLPVVAESSTSSFSVFSSRRADLINDSLANLEPMLEDLGKLKDGLDTLCANYEALDESLMEPYDCCQNAATPTGSSGAIADYNKGTIMYCKSSKPIIVRQRWHKLREELWDVKHQAWNISKVPEIYDALRYDIIHHPHLVPGGLPVYAIAKGLNDIIVPNEYGCDDQARAKIGRAVCGRLLRKLLADLNNSVAAETAKQELPGQIVTAIEFLERERRFQEESAEKDASPGGDDDDEEDDHFPEAEFLQPASFGQEHLINPHRRVRTRLYFTSESHIQTLMSVLRLCHRCSPRDKDVDRSPRASPTPHAQASSAGIVCAEMEQSLREEPVLDFLTQVVFRLYEDKRCPPQSKERYRVEVLFSPGAVGDPSKGWEDGHTMPLAPLQPLHTSGVPLNLADLQQLLGAYAEFPQQKRQNRRPSLASPSSASLTE